MRVARTGETSCSVECSVAAVLLCAEGWATLFNTPLLSTEPIPDKPGWVWDVFETTPTMSTYLIALAIQVAT